MASTGYVTLAVIMKPYMDRTTGIIDFTRCYAIYLCNQSIYKSIAIELGTGECDTIDLDMYTRFMHAVKGVFSGYKPVKQTYTPEFYSVWLRHSCLEEVAHAVTFVADMDDKVDTLREEFHAKQKECANETDDVSASHEYIALVKQIVSNINEYIDLLSNDEKTMLCMNVLVDFEHGESIREGPAELNAYYKWLLRGGNHTCAMPANTNTNTNRKKAKVVKTRAV